MEMYWAGCSPTGYAQPAYGKACLTEGLPLLALFPSLTCQPEMVALIGTGMVRIKAGFWAPMSRA